MEREMTDRQKEQLDLLEKMSNIISNSVWMAKNTDSEIDTKIDTAIWAANHFLSEIKDIK